MADLEKSNQEMLQRLADEEMAVQRLRALNQKIILSGPGSSTDLQPDQGPLSISPAEGSSQLSLHSVGNRSPPLEHSGPSASDQGH